MVMEYIISRLVSTQDNIAIKTANTCFYLERDTLDF